MLELVLETERDPNRFVNSMIEQIDALTKIANEFSNFAKMPLRSESEINLPELIERVVEVFSSEENVSLKLNIIDKQLIILADKDQLIRVFNNLIKNAIQSIPSERKGLIQINVTRNSDSVEIEAEQLSFILGKNFLISFSLSKKKTFNV